MEITVLEKKKNRLVMELKGADHTFCNVLKQELWNDKDIKSSAYSVEHPLVGVPKIIVETASKDAVKAIEAAVGRIEKINKDFLAKFKAAK